MSADLSPKQLRILKYLSERGSWATRADMIETTGDYGFSRALGTPTYEIRPGTLEALKYVERSDMSKPFEYRITELGKQALVDHERINGVVELSYSPKARGGHETSDTR